jgi:hypothetical protein
VSLFSVRRARSSQCNQTVPVPIRLRLKVKDAIIVVIAGKVSNKLTFGQGLVDTVELRPKELFLGI